MRSMHPVKSGRIQNWKESLSSLGETLHKGEFKTITLKIRLKEFETHTKSRTLPYYTNSQDMILAISKQLFEEFRGRYIRLIGIRLFNLKKEKTHQRDLLQWL